MATPHIAGIAALVRSRNPSFSVAATQSALMTTARLTTNRGTPLSKTENPFMYGSGLVNATAALNPGIVYDMGLADYNRWGVGLCA